MTDVDRYLGAPIPKTILAALRELEEEKKIGTVSMNFFRAGKFVSSHR